MVHDLELFGRIVLAVVLGGVVGWERYVRGQMAAVAVLAGAGDAVLAIAVAALVLFVLELRYMPLLDHLDARHCRPCAFRRGSHSTRGSRKLTIVHPSVRSRWYLNATVARGRLRTRARSSGLRRNG